MARAKSRTLKQIEAEIERLRKEAEAVRASEIHDVVERIKTAIQHYGLTAADLGLATGRRGKGAGAGGRKGAAQPRKRPFVIRFRDGAGHEWTGNGKRPRWFLDAIAAGKTPDDLRVA